MCGLLVCDCRDRVLVCRMKDFKQQAVDVVWHVPCKSQKEMSTKSKMVTNIGLCVLGMVRTFMFIFRYH